jgi:putative serine protease PepD
MARACRERALAALAGLAIVLVTATGCAGSEAGGYSPQSNGGDVGHALEQDFTRVVHESLPSIVEIISPSGVGSGVIFDDKGDIVTNAHVVGKSSNFQVRTSTGTQQFPATLVGSYSPEDLAVIRVQGAPNLKPAKFGRSSTLEVGDIVLAMGNPLGLDATVTNGLVSRLGRTIQECGCTALLGPRTSLPRLGRERGVARPAQADATWRSLTSSWAAGAADAGFKPAS